MLLAVKSPFLLCCPSRLVGRSWWFLPSPGWEDGEGAAVSALVLVSKQGACSQALRSAVSTALGYRPLDGAVMATDRQ